MVGNYDFTGIPVNGVGPNGAPIPIIEEGETEAMNRPPKSADVIRTALDVLGIDDHFIPGGAGTIEDIIG